MAVTFFSAPWRKMSRSEEHTSELQSHEHLVCRLLLEKKKVNTFDTSISVSVRLVSLTSSGVSPLALTLCRWWDSRLRPDSHAVIHPVVFFLIIPAPPESPLFPQPAPLRF